MFFNLITLDQLSIILISCFIFISFYNTFRHQPQPSSYPILLGMQSDISRVRRKSETPIFRNTSFGMGMLTPSHSIKSFNDLISLSNGKFDGLKNPTNPFPDKSIATLVQQVRQKILSILNDLPKPDNRSQHPPEILVLLSNPYLSLTAFTLPYHTLHIQIPLSSTTIPAHIQQASGGQLSQLKLVICDHQLESAVKEFVTRSDLHHPKIININDLLNHLSSTDLHEQNETKLQSGLFTFLSSERDGASRLISFEQDGLLAGLTASLGLLPKSKSVGAEDRVAIQIQENSVYGFQSSFAIASLYGGAKICFFNKIEELSDWHPTVLVCQADLLETLANEIRTLSSKSLRLKLGIGQRLSYLSRGILIEGVKDKELWIGEKLRSILTSGPITQTTANVVRAALGVQVQQVYAHPLVAGPVLATMFTDFQSLGLSQEDLHYGPPTTNVECKLVDVPEPAIINNDAVKGQLAVRGPTVAVQIKDPKTGEVVEDQLISEKFLRLDQDAQLLSNGTVKVFLSNGLVYDS
ncbi:uncharacterized protein MELLADRAFT_103975 [Melampsora larici-populina 98AG31]|uniref:AMP-dependent synthetase/ligase domain-containing protein n=1 Tax=Melampsora larici-populina (strain 98AG31 / pathotype 3-4-7) TaxID=747676 RepID=F4RD68_MELLP|nr:uncharacterized protein MELLADRAFT_103975 [Melampsora larici-populina 98AG31]EGG09849.1 hypothetical protein MELLADRAFT_103975 [Melampsora larici-populina 98AG31]